MIKCFYIHKLCLENDNINVYFRYQQKKNQFNLEKNKIQYIVN